jgi:hypothetical protein
VQWYSKVAHFMADRRQREAERKGLGWDTSFKALPRTYVLQPGPTSYLSPPNDAIIFWALQGINPLIRQSLEELTTSPKPIIWQPKLTYMRLLGATSQPNHSKALSHISSKTSKVYP